MKKQILLFILALLPVVAMADANGTCGDNLTWTYVESTKTLTISGSGAMSNFSSLSPWYNYGRSMKTVIISSGVTSIGKNAFQNCSGLTSITIPESVTSIGDRAFWECSGLTSITIPESVTSIGDRAFWECSSLTSITIPDSVTSIGDDAFYSCSSLTSIDIPNGVTSIGEGAFFGCSSLTSITIGSSVTSIGSSAFYNTNIKKAIWLTNTPPSGYQYVNSAIHYVSNEQFGSLNNKIVYPFLSSIFEADGIKYVPISPSERTCDAIDCVYDGTPVNTNISSTVTYRGITMSVKKVQPYVCYNNKYIESLTCDNEGEIAQYAFYGCSNMKSATLGEKITSIRDYAFYGCSNMEKAILGNTNDLIMSDFKSCFIGSNISEIGNSVFGDCGKLRNLVVADREEALKLGSNGSSPLFSDCPLDSVYIGGNITYNTASNRGYSPFYRNTTLRTVVITDKETEISENEFYGCTNLQSFTVGDGVTKFGDWAFSGCSSLKSLAFGSQLQTIGKEAFSDCTAVTKIVSKTATPPACGDQALDDINKWSCTLVVPTGCKEAYQVADQWKEFFFLEEGEGGGNPDPINPETKKCAKPAIYYSNGKLTFESETDGAICESTITDADVNSYTGNEVQLGVTYHITVKATKPDYEDSDIATATLCWIDVEPQTEGITGGEDAVSEVKAVPVLIQSNGNTLTIDGATAGTPIHVYDLGGRLIANTTATDIITTVNVPTKEQVIIVKVGDKAVKVRR